MAESYHKVIRETIKVYFQSGCVLSFLDLKALSPKAVQLIEFD